MPDEQDGGTRPGLEGRVGELERIVFGLKVAAGALGIGATALGSYAVFVHSRLAAVQTEVTRASAEINAVTSEALRKIQAAKERGTAEVSDSPASPERERVRTWTLPLGGETRVDAHLDKNRNTPSKTANLGSTADRICFLTSIYFEDVDDAAQCSLDIVGNEWRLRAEIKGEKNADATCAARCLRLNTSEDVAGSRARHQENLTAGVARPPTLP